MESLGHDCFPHVHSRGGCQQGGWLCLLARLQKEQHLSLGLETIQTTMEDWQYMAEERKYVWKMSHGLLWLFLFLHCLLLLFNIDV